MESPIELRMRYFVLKPSATDWHGEASCKAMMAYADSVEASGHPIMANQIRDWVQKEAMDAVVGSDIA